MAHPYRTRPVVPPDGSDVEARLGAPTLAFGLICVFSGLALAGSERPSVVLLAGGAGTIAIASRRGVRQRRLGRIERSVQRSGLSSQCSPRRLPPENPPSG
jgi:hypothetical protein